MINNIWEKSKTLVILNNTVYKLSEEEKFEIWNKIQQYS